MGGSFIFSINCVYHACCHAVQRTAVQAPCTVYVYTRAGQLARTSITSSTRTRRRAVLGSQISHSPRRVRSRISAQRVTLVRQYQLGAPVFLEAPLHCGVADRLPGGQDYAVLPAQRVHVASRLLVRLANKVTGLRAPGKSASWDRRWRGRRRRRNRGRSAWEHIGGAGWAGRWRRRGRRGSREQLSANPRHRDGARSACRPDSRPHKGEVEPAQEVDGLLPAPQGVVWHGRSDQRHTTWRHVRAEERRRL